MNRKLVRSLIALSASVVVLAVLASAGDPLAPVDPRSPAADSVAITGHGRSGLEPREAKIARRGLAMPYFSFARGVRRIGG